MFDQRNSDINIKCTARSMRRSGNGDLDIYGCLCKNDHTDKNDNSESGAGANIYISSG